MASLIVVARKDTKGRGLWITGTVAGRRIRQAAGTSNKRLAAERAAALEAEILRGAWHGERKGGRAFGATVLAYADAQPRRPAELQRLARLVDAIGEQTQLRAIDQETVSHVGAGRKPATLQREVITPLKAILTWAAQRGWCDVPMFQGQPQSEGRTLFLVPEEADRLLVGSAPHLRPLLLFLIGTGARLSEALELEWRDVDLEGRRVIFWRTKNGKRRIAEIPPVVSAALRQLGLRDGCVFRTDAGEPYADADRQYGGQIKRAWASAVRKSGLDAALTPHCLRHTWATWHYAMHRDLLALKIAGGWGSVVLVERYAHLAPEGTVPAIRAWLGLDGQQLRVVA